MFDPFMKWAVPIERVILISFSISLETIKTNQVGIIILVHVTT